MTTGNGVSRNTAAWALKNGIFTAAQQVFDATTTYVCMGLPSTLAMNEIVSVGNVNASQNPATLGTNRGREETLTIDVTFSVFAGGGDSVGPIVEARVFALVALLEQAVHYVRGDGTDGTTLGGVVRECFLSAITQDSMPVTEEAAGREAVAIATFTAKARITQ